MVAGAADIGSGAGVWDTDCDGVPAVSASASAACVRRDCSGRDTRTDWCCACACSVATHLRRFPSSSASLRVRPRWLVMPIARLSGRLGIKTASTSAGNFSANTTFAYIRSRGTRYVRRSSLSHTSTRRGCAPVMHARPAGSSLALNSWRAMDPVCAA